MSKTKIDSKTKKKLYIISAIIVILFISILFYFYWKKDISNTPTLQIETPQKLSLTETDTFTLNVSISDLGETIYPAASMSISFDASYLEFIGIEEGNVFVTNQTLQQQLPEWSYNSEQCNKSGLINIMYLDTTSGKNAFSKELLTDSENIVLRLKFRLRGSANIGDIYDLIFEDAIFASSDESKSLAMTKKTLKVKNSKIVIGE